MRKCMVCYGEGGERFISCGQRFSEEVKGVRTGLRWVMSGPGLIQGPMSRFMAVMQPLSGLMSEAPDTTKGREDRAVQSWSCPSLAVTLGRAGSAPHQLKH